MQEDKEPFFDAFSNLKLCLKVAEGLIREVEFNTEAMQSMADLGYITATDLADWLVKKCNIPFRDAHSITGKVVKHAENNKLTLDQIAMEDFKKIDKRITNDVLKVLSLKNSLESRDSYGGTSPKVVKKALKYAEKKWLK
jgi:argininosuccinate lyase